MRLQILALSIALCAPAEAQSSLPGSTEELVTAYLKAHALEVSLAENRLVGPAADWLRTEAAKAQFFFVGEEHDVREIPVIAGALWRELVPLGYKHVAIEAGQWLGGRLDRFSRFSDRQALTDFQAATWPRLPNNSVPPNSEEDLRFYGLLGEVSRRGAASVTPLIWGLDYEYRAAPLLRRFASIVPPAKQRQAEYLAKQVQAAEAMGSYKTAALRTEIEELIHSNPAKAGTEAFQIADALKLRIMEPAERARYGGSKELFLRNYRAAKQNGEAAPRVMLRFGSYHAARGLMRDSGGSTLANFIAELGVAERSRMLNVLFISCSVPAAEFPRPCTSEEQDWLRPLKTAAVAPWTLFDLRELRAPIRQRRMAYLQSPFDGWSYWHLAMSFDAVVYLKDSNRSHLPRNAAAANER
jgi:hypothetical protein